MKPEKMPAFWFRACVLPLLLLGLASCSFNPKSEVPASVRSLPVYPNAQQAQIQHKTDSAQIIVFQTDDSPNAVCTFYRETLARDGWFVPACPSKDALDANFEWIQTDLNGPTDIGYKLVLTATITNTNIRKTNVILDMKYFNPRLE